ncbi:trypsin-like peptidase domain-containing protein, partial [Glycomyces sp. NPDC048151]|uniref:trypsin-like peptidase domain-containing protein n=1 Tax=Glycomyces sp. NPDC048151 TaxID=3364002 RepID=UPI00371B9D4F
MFDNPSWLVRVLAKTNDGTATAGTGIAIDQRHVITCAHVLASAATNGEPVLLELPFNKAVPGRIGATVLFSHYDSDRSEDFAVLRLDDEIPDMAPPPLHRATTFKGRQAKARGFPWAESSVSSVAEVVLWDQTHRGRIQLNRSTTEGDILKGGFSGGPVWDSNVEAVIGIVVSAEANGSGAMLTLDSLQDLWPELEDRIGRFPIKTSDYESHWGPRATGSTLALSGSRFSGRSVALRQINKALADKPTPNIPTVVTGNPGAGKSAVLARIVTTAVTAPADGHRGAADEWISAKPGSVHCAVHAKGKTPDEIAAEILLAAGLHELQDIDRFPVRINVALADRERFNVVIDALDEVVPGRRKKSGNPVRDVIVKIIKPLAAIRAASVVIGSRKYAGVDVGKLLSDAAFIDLDTDDYFDPDDLVRFVSATLQDTSRDRNVAVYEDDAIAMPIAVRIAEVSNTNFLVASLLAHRHGLLDVEPVAPEDIQFSGAAKDAFREYLECLPKIKGVSADAREMLTALAFAESPGFTVDLWTAAVNCLENVTVEPDALLAFAKGPAANFLIEASTGAVPQFQLFHQALIDAAREWIKEDRRSIEECNAKLAKEFQQRVERIGWDRAPSYLTRSLATHAAAGNQLDELLKSLDFLSYADPSTLLAAMRAQPGIRERRIASAYRTRAHLYQAIPPGSARAQRILIDLARAGVKNFGIESAEACWRPRWCVGGVFDPNLVQAYSTAHRRGDANIEEEDDRVLFRGGDGEELVWKLDDDYRLTVFRALSEDPRIMGKGIVDNRSVGAEGGEDGTIHIWDLESGETVALFLAGPPDPIGLAIGEVGGRSLVINGTEDGPVVVWDLETREHVMRFEGHSDWVRSVAFGKVDGAPVAISAGDDNTVRVWDLAAGKQRAVLEGHTEWVESVAFGEVDGSPIAVSGGDDETVRVWDLRTGEQTMLDSEAGLVKAVAFGRFYGAPIAIVGNDDEIVRVWDLRTKRLMLELEGHSEQVTTVAFGEIDNIPVAISGSEDDTVRVWDLRTGAQRAVLEGHTDWVSSVAFGEIDNIPVAISGSDDNTVRVWDLRTGEQRAVLEGHTGGVLKVAFSRIDRRPVAVSTSEDDSVRVWDLQSAAPYISLGRHADWVNSIVFGAIGGTPVAISGSDDETVRVWDLRNQMQMLHFQDHIDAVNAVAFGEIDGTSIVISG